MEPVELKREFIRLRAKGESYSNICKQLQISKRTCEEWDEELASEIEERKALDMPIRECLLDHRAKEILALQEADMQEALKQLTDLAHYIYTDDFKELEKYIKERGLSESPIKNAKAISQHAKKLLQLVERLKYSNRPFYNMPDSPASNLILEVLGAGADLADLKDRKRQVNHSTKIGVKESGKRRRIALESQKASVTIELEDIEKLTGSNKAAKKLFVLTLIKANEQALYDGQLSRNYVSFPLQELVDIEFYKSLRSARTGFNSGADTLTSIKIKGHIQRSKKSESTIDVLEVLFTGAKIEHGQCTIYLNDRINWSFIAQHYTILPKYYFKLSNRASDLLYYIFYLARQHTREIEERGYFTISFRALQYRLQLPREIGNNNPERTIKQPIESAIEELEKEHSNLYNNTEFSLLPVYDDNATIVDFLNHGYLKVGLSGAFAETFIAVSKDTAQQIEADQKQRARITEKAIAINTAKKLDKEKKKAPK